MGEQTGVARRDDVVAILKALADPVRLDLFTRIAAVDEMSCTQLVHDADVTASTVSYHVKTLRNAGLVEVRKDGRNFHYAAQSKTIESLAAFLGSWPRCTRPHVGESRLIEGRSPMAEGLRPVL